MFDDMIDSLKFISLWEVHFIALPFYMICQTRSSYNWFLCFHSLDTYTSEFKLHLGIMATGAINVVRGSRSSAEELLLIYSHSNRLGNICFLSMFIYYSKDIYFRCEVMTQLQFLLLVLFNHGL